MAKNENVPCSTHKNDDDYIGERSDITFFLLLLIIFLPEARFHSEGNFSFDSTALSLTRGVCTFQRASELTQSEFGEEKRKEMQ
jgi:hypothetical protein